MSRPRRRRVIVEELLLETGALTQDRLDQARKIQSDAREKGDSIGIETILLEYGMVHPIDYAKAVAQVAGCNYVDLSKYTSDITKPISKLLPRSIAEQHTCIIFREDEQVVHIALTDPRDLEARDRISRVIPKRIQLYSAVDVHINRLIEETYGMSIKDTDLLDPLLEEIEKSIVGVQDDELVENVALVRLVNDLIAQAINREASDIHIDPMDDRGIVRFRVDGVLRDAMEVPLSLHSLIIQRIKWMSRSMDIAVKRSPQDGRIRTTIHGREVDMRVSTLPTIHGEKAVLRILDQSKGLIKMSQIGIDAKNRHSLETMISKPHGLIVVCGPTGHGKTTTLYACLNEIINPGINIVTLEDPVEYQFDRIAQVNVDQRAGVTFERGLRTILRQDPDVILVGEVRDPETAKLSVQASLTGHLVLTSLHANTSTEAIPRLLNLGVEPFLLSSALIGIISQRLVRKLCLRCREPYEPSQAERDAFEIPDDRTVYTGKGCLQCDQTGYRGRTGVFEILDVDEKIVELIAAKATEQQIRQYALSRGMTTLSQAGIQMVHSGITACQRYLERFFQ